MLGAADRRGHRLRPARCRAGPCRCRTRGHPVSRADQRRHGAVFSGDPAGQATLDEALRTALAARDVEDACRAYATSVWGLLDWFRLDEAERYLTAGHQAGRGGRVPRLPVSYLHVERARLELARGAWDEAVRRGRNTAWTRTQPTRCAALTVLGRVAVRRGQPGRRGLLAQAWELAVRRSASCSGPARPRLGRAEAAWLRGDHAGGAGHRRAGIPEAIRLGDPPQRGRARLLAGQGGRTASPGRRAATRTRCRRPGAGGRRPRPGRRPAAGTSRPPRWPRAREPDDLLAALGILDELGARPLATVVRGRLRALGVTRIPRGPLGETRANPAGLTRARWTCCGCSARATRTPRSPASWCCPCAPWTATWRRCWPSWARRPARRRRPRRRARRAGRRGLGSRRRPSERPISVARGCRIGSRCRSGTGLAGIPLGDGNRIRRRRNMDIDQDKLMDFLHRFVGDLGATMAAGNVVVGDRLGLYRALAERPLLPSELAERTGTATRYVDEWLRGQAAGGYVEYDAETGAVLAHPRAGVRADRPGRRGVRARARSSSRWARCGPSRGSPRRSGPARGSAGTSTTPRCSSAASGSSGPATSPTWCPSLAARPGRREAGCGRAAGWRTSAAATGASTVLMAPGLPRIHLHRLGLPRGVDPPARKRIADAGLADRVQLRRRVGADVRRRPVRPGDQLRLPARHGRPGRRGPAHPGAARPGRHLDGGRAGRRGQRGREPEPGRPGLLLVLHVPVRAERAVPGGRLLARRPGR